MRAYHNVNPGIIGVVIISFGKSLLKDLVREKT